MLEQVSGLGVDLEGILGIEEVRVEQRADHVCERMTNDYARSALPSSKLVRQQDR
jgi:hypothetical protein